MPPAPAPEIARWIPAIPQPYTGQSARDFIAWSHEGLERGNYFVRDRRRRHGGAPRRDRHGCEHADEDRAHRLLGRCCGAPARDREQRLPVLAGWALEEDFGRVELITDPDNVASQRVAEKVGFGREGVMRAHTLHRDGRRRDAVLFSLLPGELV